MRRVHLLARLRAVTGPRTTSRPQNKTGTPSGFPHRSPAVDTCEVVELAAVRVRDGQVVERFQSLIRCNQPITPEATKIHGYSDSDLVEQPAFADVWPRFRSFVGSSLLVAHNGLLFDVPVLNRLAAEWGGLNGLKLFDTLPLARQIIATGGVRLEDLAIRFGVDAGRSHHALDDCICLAGVVDAQPVEVHHREQSAVARTLDHIEETPDLILAEVAGWALMSGGKNGQGRRG